MTIQVMIDGLQSPRIPVVLGRVNAVAPGIVPTALFTAAGREDMVRRAATAPLRRAGTPDEIASVVAFLLSDEASYLAGEVVSAYGPRDA